MTIVENECITEGKMAAKTYIHVIHVKKQLFCRKDILYKIHSTANNIRTLHTNEIV